MREACIDWNAFQLKAIDRAACADDGRPEYVGHNTQNMWSIAHLIEKEGVKRDGIRGIKLG